MPNDDVEQLRRELADQHGTALAEKVTSRWLRGYCRLKAKGGAAALEAGTLESVLELALDQTAAQAMQALAGAGRMLTRELAGPGEAAARRFSGRYLASDRQQLRAHRQSRIAHQRDAFMQSAAPLLDTLNALKLAAREPDRDVEPCWLNATIRTNLGLSALARIAAAHEVKRIDRPGELWRELLVSSHSVGAPAYRRETGFTGAGVTVAVIDGEIDHAHPALAGRVSRHDGDNYTDEPLGSPDAHATSVAGIIGSNDATHQGIAPDVRFINKKVMAATPSLTASEAKAIAAMQDALEEGADIITCAFGAGLASHGSPSFSLACKNIWELGGIVVTSAGNRGPGAGTLTIPADADRIVVVGATDRHGRTLMPKSSRGPLPGGRPGVHVVAPGGLESDAMISCLVGGGFGPCGYGTSHAAAHVSGVLALLLQRDPTLDPDALLGMLLAMAVPLEGVDATAQGHGLVVLRCLSVP